MFKLNKVEEDRAGETSQQQTINQSEDDEEQPRPQHITVTNLDDSPRQQPAVSDSDDGLS
jgi:hypothetical protein